MLSLTVCLPNENSNLCLSRQQPLYYVLRYAVGNYPVVFKTQESCQVFGSHIVNSEHHI